VQATLESVPQLLRPSVAYHRSWLEAADESGYQPWLPAELSLAALHEPDTFAAFVKRQLADEDTGVRDGFVPSTHLWYVDGTTFLGRLSVRHWLTGWLRDYGGHIGYDVRPSARRLGHATAMLRQALPWCARLEIDPALVTCDTTNVGSRRVIEAAGGVFESELDGKYRYWIKTTEPTH
jgi:predicted acetyltransferase